MRSAAMEEERKQEVSAGVTRNGEADSLKIIAPNGSSDS